MTENNHDGLREEVIAAIYLCKAQGLNFLETSKYCELKFARRIKSGVRKFIRPILVEINQAHKQQEADSLIGAKEKKVEPKQKAAPLYRSDKAVIDRLFNRNTEPPPQQPYENGKRLRLLVGMFDQHIAGIDNTPISRPAQVALKWCADNQPDELIIGGDFGDFMSLSKWEEDYPGHKDGDYFDRAIDFCNYNLDVMQSVTRNKSGKLVYTLGNHEDWVDKYRAKDPHARNGIYDVRILLRLEDRKIDWYPVNGSYKIGHARIKHGSNANIQHATKTAGSSCGESVFYGHTHDIQCHSGIREIDLLPFVAQSCGCLCNLNPYFMRNRPNKWVHGFLIMYIRDDGSFTYYVPHIVNNRFIWNGKEYSA